MVVSIIGCGWFGLELGKALVSSGYKVKGATTTDEKLNTINEEGIEPFLIRISAEQEYIPDASFFMCDLLVITIPPKVYINGGDDYLHTQKRLIELALECNIKKLLFISSTSVYGDICSHVDEDTTPVPDTLSGQILLQAEKLYVSINTFKTTILRFGGLIGPGRDPGKFFAGKENIANGLAPVNLIHLDDCVGIAKQIISQDLFGSTINACSPHHPTRKEFYTDASQRSGLALPEFKEDLMGWKVVESKVVGERLNYAFRYNQLNPDPSL